ncbi:MAG: hypothetical protein QOG04_1872 [Actinomycetota bacterium]|jgi:hypothetical protein|nr:hypothetical protein [Actinomycetota bacterium]
MKRSANLAIALALFAGLLPVVTAGVASAQTDGTPLAVARDTEPVVLTGASFAKWAAPADAAVKAPSVNGKRCLAAQNGAEAVPGGFFDEERDCTHNTYEEPDASSSTATNEAVTGTPTDRLLGYRWTGTKFEQIPFQVDEMQVRYLSNNNSGFAFYSETDQHTTYVFDREAYRWTEDYGSERPTDPMAPCIAKPSSDVAPDKVPGLDTDDELAFMAKDAGQQAASTAPLPTGIVDSYEVGVFDPISGGTSYIYVMKAGDEGPKPLFDATNGYVRYARDDAEDKNIFLYSQSSYGDYGAAAKGPWYDPATGICHSAEAEWKQRRPSDAATIRTPRYRFRYDGRWLMTELRVNNHDDGTSTSIPTDAAYSTDLIDQWKARAFQQRPGGETPCCGYEEEVNNWGGSSILMGERSGPVRTIRETWGADSGTNVIRREIFYRSEVRFGTYLRVHVIPPADGIYAQWDYNAGIAQRYYNSVLTAQGRAEGVAIDGQDDEVFGNSRMHVASDGVRIDELTPGDDEIVVGEPTDGCPQDPIEDPTGQLDGACINNDIDSPDPTFSGTNAGLNWEEVAGPFGTLVTRTAVKQYTPGGTAQSLMAVPYYRDDSCFDDGTGSNPGPHLHKRSVDDGEYAEFEGDARTCWTPADGTPPPEGDAHFWQGSIGTHGIHILAIADSDNAGMTIPLTEIDAEQRVVVLESDPGNVGDTYGRQNEKPLLVVARPERRDAAPLPVPTNLPPAPGPTSIPSPPNPGPVPTPCVTDGPGPTECPKPKPTASSSPTATASPTAKPKPSSSPSATAQTQTVQVTTTIASDRSTLTSGRDLTLSGVVTAPRQCSGPFDVEISRRLFGTSTFEPFEMTTTASDGAWNVVSRAEYNASYRATPVSKGSCHGESSTPIDVTAHAAVELTGTGSCVGGNDPQPMMVKGTVAPDAAGTKVVLQARSKNRWIKVDSAKLDKGSRFSLSSTVCTGKFRVSWPQQTDLNLSGTKGFRLHR